MGPCQSDIGNIRRSAVLDDENRSRAMVFTDSSLTVSHKFVAAVVMDESDSVELRIDLGVTL